MAIIRKLVIGFLLLLLFWVAIFDFQRILFSIHHFGKISDSSTFLDWILVFFNSFRLDLATGALLSVIPFLFWFLSLLTQRKLFFRIFQVLLMLEVLVVSAIHSGEINAYGEWNHKLTSRVFSHLSNPDEVFRTADFSMTIWFFIYLFLEVFFSWKMLNWLFPKSLFRMNNSGWKVKVLTAVVVFPLLLCTYFITGRGGVQQIPINIDAAYFSKEYIINDISVNSPYFFAKSFLLYRRSEIDGFITNFPNEEVEITLKEITDYPKEHDNLILKNKRPNIVFIILESWTSLASEKLSGKPGVTPYFDKMTEEGFLFTNIYATASTSEIGNASIFSGYPALPEISISMQPFKHRKLSTLNEDFGKLGYFSSYMFSGDLTYGNIKGYFTDHGFDEIMDEEDFPSGLPKGKLNFYDEDLFTIFHEKINEGPEPFLRCVFTGSTHSPYDFPAQDSLPQWEGEESKFMNSMAYADKCLKDFMDNCKKEEWYDNTLFVLVADHGHASSYMTNPSSSEFYRVPLLFYGEPLKDDQRGKISEIIGSQSDIAATLLYQMEMDASKYQWSKDLLNPNTPQFALHTITRGFGWVSEEGSFTFHMDYQKYLENNIPEEKLVQERKRCDIYMQTLFEHYKNL